MKIDPRRGRILVLTEPIGIVRAIGSLLLICSFVSAGHGLLMIRDQDHGEGLFSPPFWIIMSAVTVALGLAFSAPPRWRWIFDIDQNLVRCFTVRFNIPMGDGQSFEMTGIRSAEVVRLPEGAYCVQLISYPEIRIQLQGIKSRASGWPKSAAARINEIIVEFVKGDRSTAHLNDPGVVLREAGILTANDSVLMGPALEELVTSVSSGLQKLASNVESAYDISESLAQVFQGVAVEQPIHPELKDLSRLQLVLFFDLCVPTLREVHNTQFLRLSALVEKPDQRRVRDGVYTYALSTRFARYVAIGFRVTQVEPPSGIDLQHVLPECRMVIATVADLAHSAERSLVPPRTIEGREVVFSEPRRHDQPSTLALKAYEAGIEELSSDMNAEWTAPAQSTEMLQAALNKIVFTAPAPMRGVLVRACARAATADDIMEASVWLLLRSIGDALAVNVPSFVHEPVSEARVTSVR